MIKICMVCKRRQDKEIEPLNDRSLTHGLCARCAAASEYRGGTIEEIKKDEYLEDLKDNIRKEIINNVKWIPPENSPDWKDKEFNKEDIDFYEELRGEVENEINIGLKR